MKLEFILFTFQKVNQILEFPNFKKKEEQEKDEKYIQKSSLS